MQELVLMAVMSFARGDTAKDEARLRAIASDIAAVTEAKDAPVLFDGPAGREATALMLVAIAAHESGFDPDVQRCKARGDSGRSRTMWQLIGSIHLEGNSIEDVCSDDKLAASLALKALARAEKRWPLATPQRLLNAYAAGDADKSTKSASQMCSYWQTRAEKLGMRGAYCEKKAPVEWSPRSEQPPVVMPLARGATMLPLVPWRSPTLASVSMATALCISGCEAKGADTSEPPPASAASSPADAPLARRPTKKWMLANDGPQCEIHSVDGDVVSAPKPTPCPPDLLPGERLRIAGKTCMRESSDSSRSTPAVCPDPLTNEEKKDLVSQGRAP